MSIKRSYANHKLGDTVSAKIRLDLSCRMINVNLIKLEAMLGMIVPVPLFNIGIVKQMDATDQLNR